MQGSKRQRNGDAAEHVADADAVNNKNSKDDDEVHVTYELLRGLTRKRADAALQQRREAHHYMTSYNSGSSSSSSAVSLAALFDGKASFCLSARDKVCAAVLPPCALPGYKTYASATATTTTAQTRGHHDDANEDEPVRDDSAAAAAAAQPVYVDTVRLVAEDGQLLVFAADDALHSQQQRSTAAPLRAVRVSSDVGAYVLPGDVLVVSHYACSSNNNGDKSGSSDGGNAHLRRHAAAPCARVCLLTVSVRGVDAAAWGDMARANMSAVVRWMAALLARPPGMAQLMFLYMASCDMSDDNNNDGSDGDEDGRSCMQQAGWLRSLQLPLLLDVPAAVRAQLDERVVRQLRHVILSVLRLYIRVLSQASSLVCMPCVLRHVRCELAASPLFVDGLGSVLPQCADALPAARWRDYCTVAVDALTLVTRELYSSSSSSSRNDKDSATHTSSLSALHDEATTWRLRAARDGVEVVLSRLSHVYLAQRRQMHNKNSDNNDDDDNDSRRRASAVSSSLSSGAGAQPEGRRVFALLTSLARDGVLDGSLRWLRERDDDAATAATASSTMLSSSRRQRALLLQPPVRAHVDGDDDAAAASYTTTLLMQQLPQHGGAVARLRATLQQLHTSHAHNHDDAHSHDRRSSRKYTSAYMFVLAQAAYAELYGPAYRALSTLLQLRTSSAQDTPLLLHCALPVWAVWQPRVGVDMACATTTTSAARAAAAMNCALPMLRHRARYGMPLCVRIAASSSSSMLLLRTLQQTLAAQCVQTNTASRDDDESSSSSHRDDVHGSLFAYLVVYVGAQPRPCVFPVLVTAVRAVLHGSDDDDDAADVLLHVLRDGDAVCDVVDASAALADTAIPQAWLLTATDTATTQSSHDDGSHHGDSHSGDDDDSDAVLRDDDVPTRLLPRDTPAQTYMDVIEHALDMCAAYEEEQQDEGEEQQSLSLCSASPSSAADVHALSSRALSVLCGVGDAQHTHRRLVDGVVASLPFSAAQVDAIHELARAPAVAITTSITTTTTTATSNSNDTSNNNNNNNNNSRRGTAVPPCVKEVRVLDASAGAGKTTVLHAVTLVHGCVHAKVRRTHHEDCSAALREAMTTLQLHTRRAMSLTDVQNSSNDNDNNSIDESGHVVDVLDAMIDAALQLGDVHVRLAAGLAYASSPLLLQQEDEAPAQATHGQQSAVLRDSDTDDASVQHTTPRAHDVVMPSSLTQLVAHYARSSGNNNNDNKDSSSNESSTTTTTPSVCSLMQLLEQARLRSLRAPLARALQRRLVHLSAVADVCTAILTAPRNNNSNSNKNGGSSSEEQPQQQGDEEGVVCLYAPLLPLLLSAREMADTMRAATATAAAADTRAGSVDTRSEWAAYVCSQLWRSDDGEVCATLPSLPPHAAWRVTAMPSSSSSSSSSSQVMRNVYSAVDMPATMRLTSLSRAQAAAWRAVYVDKQHELLAHVQRWLLTSMQHTFAVLLDLVYTVAIALEMTRQTVLVASPGQLRRGCALSLLSLWCPPHVHVDNADAVLCDDVIATMTARATVMCDGGGRRAAAAAPAVTTTPLLLLTRTTPAPALRAQRLRATAAFAALRVLYEQQQQQQQQQQQRQLLLRRGSAGEGVAAVRTRPILTSVQLRATWRGTRAEVRALWSLLCQTAYTHVVDAVDDDNDNGQDEAGDDTTPEYAGTHDDDNNNNIDGSSSSSGGGLCGFVSCSTVEGWSYAVPLRRVQADNDDDSTRTSTTLADVARTTTAADAAAAHFVHRYLTQLHHHHHHNNSDNAHATPWRICAYTPSAQVAARMRRSGSGSDALSVRHLPLVHDTISSSGSNSSDDNNEVVDVAIVCMGALLPHTLAAAAGADDDAAAAVSLSSWSSSTMTHAVRARWRGDVDGTAKSATDTYAATADVSSSSSSLCMRQLQLWLWRIATRVRCGVVLVAPAVLWQHVPLLRVVQRYIVGRRRVALDDVGGGDDDNSTMSLQQRQQRYWLPRHVGVCALALRCSAHPDTRRIATLVRRHASSHTRRRNGDEDDNDVARVLVRGCTRCRALCLRSFDGCTRSAHICLQTCHVDKHAYDKEDDEDDDEGSDDEARTQQQQQHGCCPYPCGRTLPCGHVCRRACGEACAPCAFVGLRELTCGQRVISGVTSNSDSNNGGSSGGGSSDGATSAATTTTIMYEHIPHWQEVACGATPQPCREAVSVMCPRCGVRVRVACARLTRHEAAVQQQRQQRDKNDNDNDDDAALLFVLSERECAGCVTLYNKVVLQQHEKQHGSSSSNNDDDKKDDSVSLPSSPSLLPVPPLDAAVDDAAAAAAAALITPGPLPRDALDTDALAQLQQRFSLARRRAQLLCMKEALECSNGRASPTSEYVVYTTAHAAHAATRDAQERAWRTRAHDAVVHWAKELRTAIERQTRVNADAETLLPLLVSEAEREAARQQQQQ